MSESLVKYSFFICAAALFLLIANRCSLMEQNSQQLVEQQIIAEADSLLQLAAAESRSKLASELAEEAYKRSALLPDHGTKAKAAHLSGLKYKLIGNLKASVIRLEEALAYYKTQKQYQTQTNDVLIDLAETYRAAGNQVYAAALLHQAHEFFKNQSNEPLLAKTYDRLAAVYFELLYNHPSMDTISNRVNLPTSQLFDTINKYQELKAYHDSLIEYLNESKILASKNNLYEFMISTQIIKAAYFRTTNQYDAALSIYNELHDLMEAQQIDADLPLILINKASLISSELQNNNLEALSLLNQSLELSEKFQINIYKALAYKLIHSIYAKLGNYEQAYIFFKKLIDIEKIIFDEHKELLLKSKDLEHQAQQDAAAKTQEKLRNTLSLISLTAISFIILLFTVFLYKKNQVKKKLLLELEVKNTLITNQHESLNELNHQKDVFLSIMAHDLKSPLSSIFGFSSLLSESLKENRADQILNLSKHIQRSSDKAIDLLNNLITWIKSQTGKINLDFKALEINGIIIEAIAFFEEAALAKDVRINNNVPESLLVFGDAQTIATVLRNLISNAIKFCHRGGEVNIDALQQEESVQISVTDNGIGMDHRLQQEIFTLNQNTGREGTAGEASTGLGLLLCKELIAMNRGTIGVESEEGKGSRFFFTIPTV